MEKKLSDQELEHHVLQLVREFIAEIKSERTLSAVSLNASLERDLGVDSLSRVELFLRIEKAFEISFPETVITQSETLKDIVTAIKTTHPGRTVIERNFVKNLEEYKFDFSLANSLLEVLVKHAQTHPNRPHIYFLNETGEEIIIRYGELLERSRKVAGGLIDLGLKKEETVALMLPTSEEFFYAFFGILLAGGVPVPIYPPMRADKIEEYAIRESAILNNAEVRILITFTQVESLGRLLRVFIKSLHAVTTVKVLMESQRKTPILTLNYDDPAMIQYTSGSTSDPKGVLLTHANLLSNIRAVGKAANLTSTDVGVSWLPLYHDMGLIGAWFCTLYHGFPLTIMSPLTFLNRPERWLWAIHYHRGTLSAGPNFAYELCIRRIKEEDIVGLDLSSWRLAFNGAEAVNPKTMERFTKKFEPYGFRPDTFYPVYGLAESSVGLTFPKEKRVPRVDVIEREPFERERLAIPAQNKNQPTLEFVCCGEPLPEHEIRIVDEQGQELPERQVGILQFTGPSAMQGYYRNPQATQAVYHEGWWDSGDYAYMADGEVFITGRKKDLIIKAGRNLYPQEIEEAVSQVNGIRRGCSVAVGIHDSKMGTEKMVIIAETAESKPSVRNQIIDAVIEKVSITIGVPPDEVCLVPPRSVPKTSSGKLQRSASKKMYLEGAFFKSKTPVWLQMSKLWIKGIGFELVNFLKKTGKIAYTLYVGILMLLFILPMWLSVVLFPKKLSQSVLRTLIRLFLWVSGIHVHIQGKENLTEIIQKKQPVIFIANHASYADAIILLSILPKNILFVGKQELQQWPLVNTVFKRFGYLPVDRIDFSKSLGDVSKIEEKLRAGNSVLIFPEGTFSYAAGLRPFKIGAFKMAVDTQTALCPISLQGTRNLLRSGSPLFSPSKIKVTIGKLVTPQAQDWAEVTRLHLFIRNEIARSCGELSLDMAVAGIIPPASEKGE